MLSKLHSAETLADFYSVQSQLTMEMELKQFFVVTPANRIGDEFKGLSGSVMNQFAYLNLVLKVIKELNIEPVQTFALLQAVRPVIYMKFDAATLRFIGKPIASTTKSGTIVFEAIELFTRLTDTYDSIINEAKRFGDSQTFIVGSAIHMAMADKVKLLLCYLRLYQEAPKVIWSNANRLYVIAQEANLLSQVFHDKLAFGEHVLSVRQVYLYILLLGSSGSRSFNIDEITSLAEFLKEWVKLVNLKKFDPSLEKNSLCIDPASMSTPVFSSEITDAKNIELLTFDLDKLIAKIDKPFIIQKFIQGVRFSLSPWTTQKIIQNWTRHQKRAVSRIGGDLKDTTALIGIYPAEPVSLKGLNNIGDGFDEPDYTSKKLDFNLSIIRKKMETLSAISGNNQETFVTKVIDYSNAGYCLEWPVSASVLLSVNEIIVIQDDEDGSCKLGQVVWIKVKSTGALRTGISIIAQQIIPVHVRLINNNPYHDERNMARGIIMISALDEREYYGVLLKHKNLQTGQIVELIRSESFFPAKLLEPFGHNNKYQLFNIAFFK